MSSYYRPFNYDKIFQSQCKFDCDLLCPSFVAKYHSPGSDLTLYII
jgi:hypothetical protein